MGRKPGHHNLQSYHEETGLYFLYGNGCKVWGNCLTCPFPDNKCYFMSQASTEKIERIKAEIEVNYAS